MSLYQRLGGSAAINAVVDKFYELMLKDNRVAHYYAQIDLNKLRIRQKQFITLVTGGPNNYEGTDMKTAHCKHLIGHFQFDATWENLQNALKFFNVQSKEIHELKQIFYSVQKQIVNKPETAASSSKAANLYQKLGGHDAVSLVVNKFYDIMLNDSRVSSYFINTNMQKQRNSQIQFISMVTGGPNHYKGKDMKAAHCMYKINHLEFDATWQNLQKAFKQFSVPQNLVEQVKQIFYSVQGDIVVEKIGSTQKNVQNRCPVNHEQVNNHKQQQKTLYQKLGGHDAVSLVVNKFYDLMLEDNRVAYYFANTNMQKQRQSQIQFISMVTGGPNNYKGNDMKKAHCPYKITYSQFDATWQNLQSALKIFTVPINLIQELKQIFYSVEGDIVHENQQKKSKSIQNNNNSNNSQNHNQTKSLYDRLGGHGAVYLVVNKFYDFVLQDERISFYFANTNMQKQRSSQIQFIEMVTGGPNHYRGKDMKTAHCPYKINSQQFDATWQNLEKAFKYFKVNQGYIHEVKQIFYSVEEDIVTSEHLNKVVNKDSVKQQSINGEQMTINSSGIVPVTMSSPRKHQNNKSGTNSPQKYDEGELMKCPHMSQKLRQGLGNGHKLSQLEKRKLKQQVISKQMQHKQVKKLNNCPYQKTYY